MAYDYTRPSIAGTREGCLPTDQGRQPGARGAVFLIDERRVVSGPFEG